MTIAHFSRAIAAASIMSLCVGCVHVVESPRADMRNAIPDAPATVPSATRQRMPDQREHLGVLYQAWDWPEVRLDSLVLMKPRYLQMTLIFSNHQARDIRLRMVNPGERTYATDENGRALAFVEAIGIGRNGTVSVRRGESIAVTVNLQAPSDRAQRITIRTSWGASGTNGGDKEFTIRGVNVSALPVMEVIR